MYFEVLVFVLLLSALALPSGWTEQLFGSGLDPLSISRFRMAAFALLTVLCSLTVVRARKIKAYHFMFPALLLMVLGHLQNFSFTDDSYISLRYARNFGDGLGLVFNAGERVEGYTSFFWVLTTGILYRVFGADPPKISLLLSIASGVLILPALYYTASLYRISRRARFYMLLILSAGFCFSFWTFSAMETAFYSLLLVCWFYTLSRAALDASPASNKLLVFSSSIAAVAGLTRPETPLLFVFTLPLLLSLPRKGQGILKKGDLAPYIAYLAPFVLAVGLHFLFRLNYYGAVWPNTFYAKSDRASIENLSQGAAYILHGSVAHLLIICLAVLGAMRAVPFRKALFPMVFAVSILGSVLYTGGDGFLEYRYFYYALPFLCLLAGMWLDAPPGLITDEGARSRPKGKEWLVVVCALVSLVVPFEYGLVGHTASFEATPRQAEAWSKVGEWLREHAAAHESVAAFPIGAIGYYSGLTLIDMHGLTDRHIARGELRSGFRGHQKYDGAYVASRKPDYIFIWHVWIDSWESLRKSAEATSMAFIDLLNHISEDEYRLLNVEHKGQRFSLLKRKVD